MWIPGNLHEQPATGTIKKVFGSMQRHEEVVEASMAHKLFLAVLWACKTVMHECGLLLPIKHSCWCTKKYLWHHLQYPHPCSKGT